MEGEHIKARCEVSFMYVGAAKHLRVNTWEEDEGFVVKGSEKNALINMRKIESVDLNAENTSFDDCVEIIELRPDGKLYKHFFFDDDAYAVREFLIENGKEPS